MVKQYKTDAVKDLTDRFQKAKSVVLTDYRGLTVSEVTDLRNRLRSEQVEYKVVKNRLAKIALEQAGCDPLDDVLTGPTAIAFGYQDPVPPARVIYDFAKSNEKLQPKGGLLEGKSIDLPMLERLSRLPGREELMVRILGSLNSPGTKLAYSLKQMATSLVYALNALADQKRAESK